MQVDNQQVIKVLVLLILAAGLAVGLTGYSRADEDNRAFELEGLDGELLVSQRAREDWGGSWSAPTASGIIFGYLAERDYPKLVPNRHGNAGIDYEDVVEVVEKLGKAYTDTDPEEGTKDPYLVDGLARYLHEKYPEEFVLKVYDSDFSQQFLQVKGKSLSSKLYGVPIYLYEDPEFEDYRTELEEGEMVWLGIPKKEQEDNHFLVGRSFVPEMNSLGNFPVDLVEPYESSFNPGKAQIIETTMSTDGMVAYSGKRIKSDILIALSPREEAEKDGQKECRCGSWQDTDGDGIADVEIEGGEIVNDRDDRWSATIRSTDTPIKINPSYQCVGSDCSVTYGWLLEVKDRRGEPPAETVVGAQNLGPLAPPLEIMESDLAIFQDRSLQQGLLTIRSYCNGQFCEEVRFRLIPEFCNCGEWDDVEVGYASIGPFPFWTVNCGDTLEVPLKAKTNTILVKSSTSCEGCYGVDEPNYSWKVSSPGGVVWAAGNGNLASFPISDEEHATVFLQSSCKGLKCPPCKLFIEAIEDEANQERTDKPDLTTKITDCTYTVEESCIKWEEECSKWSKYCEEWDQKEQKCIEWGRKCVDHERVCKQMGKKYETNLDFVVKNVGEASADQSVASVVVFGEGGQTIKRSLITEIASAGQQVVNGLAIETDFIPQQLKVCADYLESVQEADEGNNCNQQEGCKPVEK